MWLHKGSLGNEDTAGALEHTVGVRRRGETGREGLMHYEGTGDFLSGTRSPREMITRHTDEEQIDASRKSSEGTLRQKTDILHLDGQASVGTGTLS